MSVQIAPDRICRICLSESRDLKSLCAKTEDETKSILDSLHFVVNIQVSVEDKLPKQICSTCEIDLCSAEEFKRRCLNSEKVLSEHFNLSNKNEIIEELARNPVKIKLENLEEISTRQEHSKNKLKRKLSDKCGSFPDEYKDVPILGINMKIEPTSDPDDTLTDLTVEVDPNDYFTGLEDTKNTVMSKEENFAFPQIKSEETQTIFSQKSESKRRKIEKIQKTINKHKRIKQDEAISLEKASSNHEKESNITSNSEKEEKVTSNNEIYEKILRTREQKLKTDDNTDSNTELSEPDMNPERHICPTCNKEYKLAFNLRAHIIKVHIRGNRKDLAYECEICKASFPQLSFLNRHVAKMHTGALTQICSLCGKKLSCKYSLQEHMKRHNGEKPVPCDQCEKRFISKAELIIHQRVHNGEKPYACDLCGRNFKQISSMVRHRRTHTGERPYNCDVCSKDFTAKASLEEHQRIHTGEKPFPCVQCGLKFRRRHHLKTHLKQHDGNRKRYCRPKLPEASSTSTASDEVV